MIDRLMCLAINSIDPFSTIHVKMLENFLSPQLDVENFLGPQLEVENFLSPQLEVENFSKSPVGS